MVSYCYSNSILILVLSSAFEEEYLFKPCPYISGIKNTIAAAVIALFSPEIEYNSLSLVSKHWFVGILLLNKNYKRVVLSYIGDLN